MGWVFLQCLSCNVYIKYWKRQEQTEKNSRQNSRRSVTKQRGRMSYTARAQLLPSSHLTSLVGRSLLVRKFVHVLYWSNLRLRRAGRGEDGGKQGWCGRLSSGQMIFRFRYSVSMEGKPCTVSVPHHPLYDTILWYAWTRQLTTLKERWGALTFWIIHALDIDFARTLSPPRHP